MILSLGNWEIPTDLQLNSSPERLVNTLIFIEQCNCSEKIWRGIVHF